MVAAVHVVEVIEVEDEDFLRVGLCETGDFIDDRIQGVGEGFLQQGCK